MRLQGPLSGSEQCLKLPAFEQLCNLVKMQPILLRWNQSFRGARACQAGQCQLALAAMAEGFSRQFFTSASAVELPPHHDHSAAYCSSGFAAPPPSPYHTPQTPRHTPQTPHHVTYTLPQPTYRIPSAPPFLLPLDEQQVTVLYKMFSLLTRNF